MNSAKNLKVTTAALMCVLCVFLILFGAEFIFRTGSHYKVSGTAYDKNLGWRFVKGLHVRQYSTARKKNISFSTNSIGFRDREHAIKKNNDIKRIMFLGDSYTAGVPVDFVSDEEIFTRRFAEKVDAHDKFDVMNVSCPAWSTDQELLFLQNEGMNYRPDYIFLMIAPNDIREAYIKSFFTMGAGRSLKRNRIPSLSWKERFCWFLSNRSSFYQFLQKKILKTNFGHYDNIFTHFPVFWHIAGAPSVDAPLFLKEMPEEVEKARYLFKMIISEINNLCIAEKCKLILVVLPTKMQINNQLDDVFYQRGKISDYVKNIADEQGILFLDLFSSLHKEEDPNKIFLSHEFHFSVYGHSFVAGKLYDFFSEISTANQKLRK
ncbi:MAG: SGNH/GDSL hydrolase family protein [Candidatus Omnitrophota bacterium]|jgi:hypothetical protein